MRASLSRTRASRSGARRGWQRICTALTLTGALVASGLLAPTSAGAAESTAVTPPAEFSITGDLAVGSTVTVPSTGWAPESTTVAYVWKADADVVAQGDEPSLALVPAMAGRTISVEATGTSDGHEPAVATAVASEPVANGTVDPVPTPTITGIVRVGEQLTAEPGTWPEGATFTYEWLRDGAPIAGATGQTLVLAEADRAHTIAVTVTGEAPGYEPAGATSASTAPVAAGVFSAAPTPTISGTARVGRTVTALAGTWSPSATLTYAWRANGSVISGATARSLALGSALHGKKITVSVTGARPGYTPVSRTSAGVVVGAGTFSSAPIPRISGTAEVGRTLTAAAGTWSPSATLSYQWRVDGARIPGATSRTFTVPSAYWYKRISVTVTARRTAYATTSRTSAQTPRVTKKFSVAPRPRITGTTRVFSYLTATVGTWSPSVGTVSYQWKRNGVSITGATGKSYRLTEKDHGKKITVRVLVKRSGYTTTSRTSYATAAIAAPAPTLRSDGTFAVGSSIAAGTYYAPGGAGCYWERRRSGGSSIDGVIANHFSSGGRNIVTIRSTDRYFVTDGCGSWTRLANIYSPASHAGQGMHKVGLHLRPGTYYAEGSSQGCYWELATGFGGTFAEIVENDFTTTRGVFVDIYADDVAFKSWGCGTWTRVG